MRIEEELPTPGRDSADRIAIETEDRSPATEPLDEHGSIEVPLLKSARLSHAELTLQRRAELLFTRELLLIAGRVAEVAAAILIEIALAWINLVRAVVIAINDPVLIAIELCVDQADLISTEEATLAVVYTLTFGGDTDAVFRVAGLRDPARNKLITPAGRAVTLKGNAFSKATERVRGAVDAKDTRRSAAYLRGLIRFACDQGGCEERAEEQ